MVVFNNLPPRHCFGRSTTIINNNFIRVPMFRPIPRPVFFGGGCCGGGNIFNMMAGFSMAKMFMGTMSNLFGFGTQSPNYYGGYNNYNNNNSYTSNNSSSCNCPDYSEQIKEINNKLDSLLDALKPDNTNNEITTGKDKTEGSEPVDKTSNNKNNKADEVKDKNNTEVKEEKEPAEISDKNNVNNNTPSTLTKEDGEKFDNALNTILDDLGYTNLTDAQKSNIKNNISDIYQDENGNLRYNIKSVVHDTDTVDKIIKRFYTNGETPELTVGKATFNTQNSETNTITEPHSGDTIIANNISDYGLAALINDAKGGITRQGEIGKTNKRITQLKSDFESGKNKLSWAYISQNNIMSKEAYDKIIAEKYSK